MLRVWLHQPHAKIEGNDVTFRAVGASFVPLSLLTVFAVMAGMAVYAYYEGCDPLTSGKVTKADQIVPYMVVNIFRDMPGLSGLFVSAAFCGTLR